MLASHADMVSCCAGGVGAGRRAGGCEGYLSCPSLKSSGLLQNIQQRVYRLVRMASYRRRLCC